MRRIACIAAATVSAFMAAGLSVLWVRSGSHDDALVVRGLFGNSVVWVGTRFGRLYIAAEESLEPSVRWDIDSSATVDLPPWEEFDRHGAASAGFLWRQSDNPYWSGLAAVPLWFAVAAALAAAMSFVRLSRRAAAGACPACGYDLRATPGRCPECGTDPAVAARAKARRRHTAIAAGSGLFCFGCLWLWSQFIARRGSERLPLGVNLAFLLPTLLSAWLAFRSALRMSGDPPEKPDEQKHD